MPCDVPGCRNETFMGWAPIGEQKGKQICEYHFRRHDDPEDDFDLFKVFGFKRPVGIRKPAAKKDVPRCACGQERLPRRRLCMTCAAERERARKRRAYHERKNRPQKELVVQADILQCKACGAEREAGHTYCPKCAEQRRKQSNRERQRQHYARRPKCVGLT